MKEKHCSIYDKTPFELELELKLSQIELNELNNELNNLKDMKEKSQLTKLNSKNEIFETKVDCFLKKSDKKISKLTQKVDPNYLFK